MEHWLIIFMLDLIRGVYQQTVADASYDPMVKQRMQNNLIILTPLKRRLAVRSLERECITYHILELVH